MTDACRDADAWEQHLLKVTGLGVDYLVAAARDAGLSTWSHNARTYELQQQLLHSSLRRDDLALLTALCLSRFLDQPIGDLS